MVRPEGVEPPAYRFEACRSIHLSYGRKSDRELGNRVIGQLDKCNYQITQLPDYPIHRLAVYLLGPTRRKERLC